MKRSDQVRVRPACKVLDFAGLMSAARMLRFQVPTAVFGWEPFAGHFGEWRSRLHSPFSASGHGSSSPTSANIVEYVDYVTMNMGQTGAGGGRGVLDHDTHENDESDENDASDMGGLIRQFHSCVGEWRTSTKLRIDKETRNGPFGLLTRTANQIRLGRTFCGGWHPPQRCRWLLSGTYNPES